MEQHPALASIPRQADDYAAPALQARHALCQDASGRELAHLAGEPVDPQEARGKVENMLGFAQVPIGLAGPLLVDLEQGRRELYVPMATTEGALVASYSRGMKLLRAAGGVRSRVTREVLTQHPVLVYADARGASAAAQQLEAQRAEFERLTGTLTRHGRLVELSSEQVGRRLILCLGFFTADAIGINMAASASELCCAHFAELTSASERYVHGEDVEKRANARALIEGRGRSVIAEARIPRDLLMEGLRVTPEALVAIQRTYSMGFARLGTQNHLVQSANGLAAVFIACGQDAAYVTESATGFLDLECTPEGDLQAAASLPSLLVGTVGGGSGQGTALECLQVLGVAGEGGANAFAEILGAVVLAGDLSLLASFCTHEFVAAHERLGRNRPG